MKACGLVLAVATLGACSSIDNHLLEGQVYEAAGACLSPPQAIDDVSGADPGQSCSPTCLVAAQDGGPVVVITTTCGPYPSYFTSEVQDAATAATDPCKGAFAAYAAGTVCVPDGGTPDATVDVHADGEAGADTGSDASTDTHTAADGGSEAAVDAPGG